MITTDTDAALATLMRQLERQAAALAEANALSTRMARRGDERRWRRPDLLWPLSAPRSTRGI